MKNFSKNDQVQWQYPGSGLQLGTYQGPHNEFQHSVKQMGRTILVSDRYLQPFNWADVQSYQDLKRAIEDDVSAFWSTRETEAEDARMIFEVWASWQLGETLPGHLPLRFLLMIEDTLVENQVVPPTGIHWNYDAQFDVLYQD